MNVQLTLGQNDRSSNCTVVLADPGGAIASDLVKHTLTNGGIQALRDSSDSTSNSTTTTNTTSTTTPSSTASSDLTPFRKAFLDTIAYSEGTFYGVDGGYKVLVGGSSFNGYSDHPRVSVYIASIGKYSTAAGRYQVLDFVYDEEKRKLKLTDFSKASQDKIAISRIAFRGGLGFVDSNNFEAAVNACRKEWASFPSAGYGQGENTMTKLKNFYVEQLKKYGVVTTNIQQKQEPAKAQPTATASPQPNTETYKGNKLTVSIGSYSFEFFHQGTHTNQDGRTTLSGQGIRWVLNRRKRNNTYQQLKLSELAAKIAKAHKVKLDYQAQVDLTYDHIDQTGISDYQLLLRECKQAGLLVSESNGTLTIKALSNIQDTTLILQPGVNLIAWEVKDTAVDDSQEDQATSRLQNEYKVRLNPITGQFEYDKPDIDSVRDKSTTGKPSAQPTGTLQPGQEALASQGRSQVKRVKGLPATFVVPLTEQILALEPMQAIRTKGLPPIFSRIWMVDSVTHDVAEGKTTVSCYSPIEVLDLSTIAGKTTTPTPSTTTGLPNFIFPCKGYPVTDVRRQRTPTRFHHGTDVGCPVGTPIVAAMDGIVSVAESQAGYGLVVYLKHPSGWSTRYAHLSQIKVKIGQQVKQGAEIALSGNTGIGTGAHLHFEIRKPDGNSADPSETNLGAVTKGQVL